MCSGAEIIFLNIVGGFMKYIKMSFGVILVILSFMLISCQKDLSLLWSVMDNTTNKAMEGYLIDATGCKDQGVSKRNASADETEDIIQYEYKNGTLTIDHINTGFNCCPDTVGGHVFVEGDTITILEYEILENGGCRCLCLYDLKFEIKNVKSGIIRLTVFQPLVAEGDEVHDFIIDLSKETSGENRIFRSDYPWGI